MGSSLGFIALPAMGGWLGYSTRHELPLLEWSSGSIRWLLFTLKIEMLLVHPWVCLAVLVIVAVT